MTKFTRLLGLAVILTFPLAGFSLADESDVAALRDEIRQLNNKVVSLERQVQTAAASHVETATPYAAAPSGGGLLHTKQDINFTGYVESQFNENFSSKTANAGANRYRAFDSNENTFTVNQIDLDFSKEANPEGGAGFNAEILAGEDAGVINAATTGSTGVGAAGLADRITFLNAYAQLVAPLKFLEGNDLLGHTIDFKMGRFVTLAGAEVVRSPDNWNVSRSLLFNLAEPVTHTGLRATYKLLQDKVTTYWGVNNGWDEAIDNNTFKTFEWGIGANPLEKVSVSSAVYYGPERAQTEGHKRFLWSNVIGWDATDKLSLKAALDLGNERRVPGLASTNEPFLNTHWWGIAGYGRYAMTDKWGLVSRIEYFRDQDFYRTGLANGGVTGQADSVFELTVGTDYKLYDNLISRFEYRWDKADANNAFSGQASQSTVGAQVIYSFA